VPHQLGAPLHPHHYKNDPSGCPVDKRKRKIDLLVLKKPIQAGFT